ncbi:cucumisin-like [Jatropha curcas]|uniref:cucumisin-like n=1 Tax=Jatropha curcas TaxID=180498 RepID=UPI0005FB2267|nr:cucumisin-like [Jatropha curcas]
MTIKMSAWLLLLNSFNFALLISGITAARDIRKSYIVYMGEQLKGEFAMSSFHHLSMLQKVIGSNFSPKSLHHSFTRSFNGFVAELTEDEAQKIAGLDNVVSVFPSEVRTLDTTRSWDFLGFSQQVQRATLESDIIIGVFDSGIWPESESFNDEGFGPPPSRWKGSCQVSSNFTCNNKIIGAKYYRESGSFRPSDDISPRDTKGHGTHVASTAAGNIVSEASVLGVGLGTAKGGVPSARIAVYKVCWEKGCKDGDTLKAFDDAIADGVDIISISIGEESPEHYFKDPYAIGAFHAMKNGVFVSISAGNLGPDPSSITKCAPWYLSVAASTIDRKFISKVQLGNNQIYEGIAINTFDLSQTMYPLIYGGDAPNKDGNFTPAQSSLCEENSLDPDLVKGKIVLCDDRINGETALLAGAIGTVMKGRSHKHRAYNYPLPASYIGDSGDENNSILSYIRSTSNAIATINKSIEVNNPIAPFVPYFSSRGPNSITPDILKPDIAAPGVNILAAWSPVRSATGLDGDNRFLLYKITSGTSMACPHATGVAAYIKSYHPTWSPSAIKSAIMTTASPMSSEWNSDAEFAYGSGHINPLKAKDPGLVYDAEPIDYIKFLCGQGYDIGRLRQVTGDFSVCSEENNGTVWDLNYPSFALSTRNSTLVTSRVFNRTVTNVGLANSTYKATVTSPPGLNIEVNPSILAFTSLGQNLSFTLTVEGNIVSSMASASLVWDDGIYQVRSPIVVFFPPNFSF